MWGYRLANTLSVTLSHTYSSVIFFFHIDIKSINSNGDVFGTLVTTFKWTRVKVFELLPIPTLYFMVLLIPMIIGIEWNAIRITANEFATLFNTFFVEL